MRNTNAWARSSMREPGGPCDPRHPGDRGPGRPRRHGPAACLLPGIGPIGATALMAAVGDARQFRKARDLAAWLGLVPRQRSTGGKSTLLGISKRGNPYVRRLLIHGARSCLLHLDRTRDRLGAWITALASRMHVNKVIVALANKLARIAWVIPNAPRNALSAGGSGLRLNRPAACHPSLRGPEE
jgi:hypothetical protein